MKMSPEGIEFLKRHEGLRLKAYKCTGGVWTIGYGSTRGVKEGMIIGKAEAEQRLIDDIQIADNAVDALVDVPLNQHQHDALVSFVYNVGVGAFQNSRMRQKLNAGKYNAAAEQFGLWIFSGGRRTQGLINRRREERALFLKPWTPPKRVILPPRDLIDPAVTLPPAPAPSILQRLRNLFKRS